MGVGTTRKASRQNENYVHSSLRYMAERGTEEREGLYWSRGERGEERGSDREGGCVCVRGRRREKRQRTGKMIAMFDGWILHREADSGRCARPRREGEGAIIRAAQRLWLQGRLVHMCVCVQYSTVGIMCTYLCVLYVCSKSCVFLSNDRQMQGSLRHDETRCGSAVVWFCKR